jgi:subtilisin-like proprotein convertase family protein
MRHQFVNATPVAIDPGPPNTVRSDILVSGVDDGPIEEVVVSVDIDHTWAGDLSLVLRDPDGRPVTLAARRGGHQDDFHETVFDAAAPHSIADARPPFRGRFRPDGDLAALTGRMPTGTWTLEVRDHAAQDGGRLLRWQLAIVTGSSTPSAFDIDVRFVGGLSSTQRDVFDLAAQAWREILVGDLPAVVVMGETVDDIVIEAQGVPLDGEGGVLGQAGPTWLRPGAPFPAWGVMSFDTADLARMEADGSLLAVILHEMGHVLGFGTIWDELGLRRGAGTLNPVFLGPSAMREFAALRGGVPPEPVPLANVGGIGTRDSHWREAVFGNELMTGFLDGVLNPISRLTVGAFEDMGYRVAYEAAGAYALPDRLWLAVHGVGAERLDHGDHGIMLVPPKRVLPDDALVRPERGRVSARSDREGAAAADGWSLPLTEVSALAVRGASTGGRELVAVSDEQFDVLTVELDDTGAPGRCTAHMLATVLPPDLLARTDGSEFEGVACDGAGRVFILQEGPARVLVLAPGLDRLERVISLDVAEDEPGFGVEWHAAGNARGEGLTLLRNGRLLVAKQRDPVRLIEFGPPGVRARGAGTDELLPADDAFELPAAGDRLVVLTSWGLSDASAQQLEDITDIATGDDGRLYVIGGRSRCIGRIESRVSPRAESVTIDAHWDLPSRQPGDPGRAEGLALLPAMQPLISIDTRSPTVNLVRLEALRGSTSGGPAGQRGAAA